VPADARLLNATDLHLKNQRSPVSRCRFEKEAKPGDESQSTLVLLGTSVVSGTATAQVLKTGTKTQFGDIATRLRARPPETEFDRGLKQFGSLIMKAVFGLVSSFWSCALAPPQRVRISAVCRRLGSGTHPRIPAHDHFGDSCPWCRGHGKSSR